MYCLTEITLYPLDKDYETPILDFISRLNAHPGLEISTGETSTVMRGDYDLVMKTLAHEMKVSLEGTTRMSFVLKVLNTEVNR